MAGFNLFVLTLSDHRKRMERDKVDHIAELALSDLKTVHGSWADAKKGAMLQLRVGDLTVIAMRTSYKFANGELAALAIIAGPQCGDLIIAYADERPPPPAIDVTEHVALVAHDPAPFELGGVKPGNLLRHADYPEAVFMWAAESAGLPPPRGAVCVSSNRADVRVGDCLHPIDGAKLSGLAQSIGFVLRSQ
jgi:hypothetical protein